MNPSARFLACAVAFGLGALMVRGDSGEVTAVSAKASDGYVRKKLPDGRFEPETYAFGEGGKWAQMSDPTVDKLRFIDIARTITAPLASQQYVTGQDPQHTQLLIMVYWGTTAGTSDSSSTSVALHNLAASQHVAPPPPPPPSNGGHGPPAAATAAPAQQQIVDESLLTMVAMENRIRDRTDWKNARILGFDEELKRSSALADTPFSERWDDLRDEVEDNRYFVVLMAYDFQMLLKEKKPKVLWITRFSIRERRNDFSKELAGMALTASRYFGQDSHGLVRKPTREGHVEINDYKVLGFEVAPEKTGDDKDQNAKDDAGKK